MIYRKALRLVSTGLAAAAMAGSAIAAAVPRVDQAVLRDAVKTISADSFEGRGPSTPAEQKTLDAIVARFKAAGLRPGNKGSWLQDVPMVAITAQNATPLTVTGGAQPLSFTGGTDFTIGSYRVVPHTEISDSELVFVGYGINAPELGWNDYAGIDMKGKIAVILVNDPDYEMQGEDGPFKGRRMTYYGRWTYKYEIAAQKGAAGVLIIHETGPAGYPFNVVQGKTSEQFDLITPDKNMGRVAIEGWLSLEAGTRLLQMAGQDFATL
ncbi:MAG: hypothetical protein RIS94_2098, partial [Pseudomonadota bacterium]